MHLSVGKPLHRHKSNTSYLGTFTIKPVKPIISDCILSKAGEIVSVPKYGALDLYPCKNLFCQKAIKF